MFNPFGFRNCFPPASPPVSTNAPQEEQQAAVTPAAVSRLTLENINLPLEQVLASPALIKAIMSGKEVPLGDQNSESRKYCKYNEVPIVESERIDVKDTSESQLFELVLSKDRKTVTHIRSYPKITGPQLKSWHDAGLFNPTFLERLDLPSEAPPRTQMPGGGAMRRQLFSTFDYSPKGVIFMGKPGTEHSQAKALPARRSAGP